LKELLLSAVRYVSGGVVLGVGDAGLGKGIWATEVVDVRANTATAIAHVHRLMMVFPDLRPKPASRR
jgi:hypothetical protein